MSKITGKELMQMIMQDKLKHRQKLKYRKKVYEYDADFKDFINDEGKGELTLIYDNSMTLRDFLEGTFELIEDKINIQEIEELDKCKFGHGNAISQQEVWYIDKVNEIIKTVKQLDREIKETKEK